MLKKATGRVKHVINGALAQIALDIAVNSASERGLLGIALHPQFARQPIRLFVLVLLGATRVEHFPGFGIHLPCDRDWSGYRRDCLRPALRESHRPIRVDWISLAIRSRCVHPAIVPERRDQRACRVAITTVA